MLFEPDLSNPWLARAVALRETFATDAVERDRAGGRPRAQIQALKDAGLLTLLIPRAFGGEGEPWSTALRIVREFAKVDGSLAHLFGYHFAGLQGLRLRAGERAPSLYRRSVQGRWFWGNTTNSFSRSLFGRREGEWAVLDGFRPFTSGAHVADFLTVAWEDEGSGERHFAAIPADRAGLVVEDDWDGIGQRQTGSGTVSFHGVRIHESEFLGVPTRFDPTAAPDRPHLTLTSQQQQSVLLNVFVGTAQGALVAARDYTVQRSRPWLYSGVDKHTDDPWVQRQYGELVTRTQAATALADRALRALDAAWARGEALSAEERGDTAVAIAAANVLAGEVALQVGSEVFELMGARSAVRAHGFDRFWRNARIHTLHNPAEYKTRNVGHWVLTGQPPEPGTFQ